MSTSDITATDKRDVYAQVTAQIINAIEQGVGTWRMPWHTSGRYAFSPINVASKKPYRGINTVCLWATAQAKGYERGEWATYQQWQDKGAQVRKGEKATLVVFWKFANDSTETQEGETSHSSRLLFTRGYSVFNAAQVDGYVPAVEADVTMPERIERADGLFRAIGANVRHGGNRAFYAPASDQIQMPPFQAFAENVAYYSTLAHEHTHWTANTARCDRQLGKRFGDSAYAAEELIAELGAAFTCAHLGLSTEPREDHAQYLAAWLKVLKADSRAIFTAARKAQQATDWMIARAGESVGTVGVAALSTEIALVRPVMDCTETAIVLPSPLEQAREFARQSKAENTLRGYRADWKNFCVWCEAHGVLPLLATPETVAGYIAECAGRLKVGTIQRRLNAVAEAHKGMGLESPTHHAMVTNTMKGIRRTKGTAPAQKAATLTDDIRAMIDATDTGIIGARDSALVLLGFAGAFRRSEIVNLDSEDCAFGKEGLTVTLRRSKTDQDGAGRKIGIPYGSNPETCPVRTIQVWIEAAAITSGPLFRSLNRHGQVQPGRLSGIDVARVVKKLVERAGLDPAKYAGHSLRAGHATSAANAGASERSIMKQTGHRSVQMVRRYIRDGSLFRENSAGRLGL